MSFYRSPAPTDNFITAPGWTDGAGVGRRSVVRGYSTSLLRCCGWRCLTDLINLSRPCWFRPSCGWNFLPPTKKLLCNCFAQTALEERLLIFKSIESGGRWGGNGLELGEQQKCQVLNVWLFGESNVGVEPHDSGHRSSSHSPFWWIHPVIQHCPVCKWSRERMNRDSIQMCGSVLRICLITGSCPPHFQLWQAALLHASKPTDTGHLQRERKTERGAQEQNSLFKPRILCNLAQG